MISGCIVRQCGVKCCALNSIHIQFNSITIIMSSFSFEFNVLALRLRLTCARLICLKND